MLPCKMTVTDLVRIETGAPEDQLEGKRLETAYETARTKYAFLLINQKEIPADSKEAKWAADELAIAKDLCEISGMALALYREYQR